MESFMAMTSYEQKMTLVLQLGSLKYSFSDIISECEVNRQSSDKLLHLMEIAKSKIITWPSRLLAVKQFAYGCSLVLGLHRFIIPFSRRSCQVSLVRKDDISQGCSN
jgi:hypothetical protein